MAVMGDDDEDDILGLSQPQNYPSNPFDALSAAMRIAAAAPEPGDAIHHASLIALMGLENPDEPGISLEVYKHRKFRVFTAWRDTKDILLREFSMDFVSVVGFGYKRVRPQEQAALAEVFARNQASKKFSQAYLRATHVDLSGLTITELAQRNEALERIARQRQTLHRTRRPDPLAE